MYRIYESISKSTSSIEFAYAIMWYLQCFIEETSVPVSAKGHKDNGEKKLFSHPASYQGIPHTSLILISSCTALEKHSHFMPL